MPTSETDFSAQLKKNILRQGIFCYKTSDRVQFGIPDLYVRGGNWIEDKFSPSMPTGHGINILNDFRPGQITFLNAAAKGGDGAYASVLFNDKKGAYFVLMRWVDFKHVRNFAPGDIKMLGAPVLRGQPLPLVAKVFDKRFPRNTNDTILIKKFALWKKERPHCYEPMDRTISKPEVGVIVNAV